MKRLFIFLLLSLLLFQVKGQEENRVFEVPLKFVSFLLLNDPKCPLQLSNPRVFRYKSGNLGYYYTVFNNSDKAVKSFRTKEFSAFVNPSSEHTPNVTATDEFSFLPFESFSTLQNENKLKITELDEKKAAEFGLSENRKRIWIVIVTKVELYDGTVYDATSKYSRVQKFIEQIETEENEADELVPKLTVNEKEEKLSRFIIENVQQN